MPQAATIKSLPRALRIMKGMQAQGIEWGEDYRGATGEALKAVLAGHMAAAVDRHLAEMEVRGEADRRNGFYSRHLLTELGDIELEVPRTRHCSALQVIRAYARRARHVERMILACFVLGLSTRKVATALLPVLGRRISASTVSQVAKTLHAAVAAFHRRALKDQYRVLMLDGVVLARKTGAGAIRRPVLVVLGLGRDGRKEIIDYHLASAESAAQWELFLGDLIRRGLSGQRL
jgi:putative transposase